ncbi:PTS system mannose/fructose/sorbose family transporter subunit IID [Megalodesulfovibrio paquesii]
MPSESVPPAGATSEPLPEGTPGARLGRALARCFLRSYMVAAAFNTRGMQNVGLIYAMEPGLQVIYSDPNARRDARQRYVAHYNSHPFWTPLLVGVFLSLEDKIAKGLFPPQVLTTVKDTTVYTLSAIGDSLFSGSLLVFWSLSTACLVAGECETLALLWGLAWFFGLHAFKFITFWVGFKEGLKFLTRLKRWRLIDWAQRLKYGNAVLLALFLHLSWPGEMLVGSWFMSVAVVGAAAVAVYYGGIGREVIALLVLTAATALPLLLV